MSHVSSIMLLSCTARASQSDRPEARRSSSWERSALMSRHRISGSFPNVPHSYTAGHTSKDSFSKISSAVWHTWYESDLGSSVFTCVLICLFKNGLLIFTTVSVCCKTQICQRNLKYPNDGCMRVCISAFILPQAILSFLEVFLELQLHMLWELNTSKDGKMMGLYTKPATVTSWENAFKSLRAVLRVKTAF